MSKQYRSVTRRDGNGEEDEMSRTAHIEVVNDALPRHRRYRPVHQVQIEVL